MCCCASWWGEKVGRDSVLCQSNFKAGRETNNLFFGHTSQHIMYVGKPLNNNKTALIFSLFRIELSDPIMFYQDEEIRKKAAVVALLRICHSGSLNQLSSQSIMKVRKALFQHDEPWRFTQGRWVTGTQYVPTNNQKIQFSPLVPLLFLVISIIVFTSPLHEALLMDY